MAKAKNNRKLLLVALQTDREVDGAMRRVLFKSKSVVDLTDEELETFDKLTEKTGKLHYRDPIQEGGAPVGESEPEVVVVPDYAGQDTPISKKNVDQLKAYLAFHSVTYADDANKAALVDLATKHEAGQTDDKSGGSGGGTGTGDDDKDNGL